MQEISALSHSPPLKWFDWTHGHHLLHAKGDSTLTVIIDMLLLRYAGHRRLKIKMPQECAQPYDRRKSCNWPVDVLEMRSRSWHQKLKKQIVDCGRVNGGGLDFSTIGPLKMLLMACTTLVLLYFAISYCSNPVRRIASRKLHMF